MEGGFDMLCAKCGTTMLKGEPDVIDSSFPIGVRIAEKRIGGLQCCICPHCANVVFTLSPKAHAKLAKLLSKNPSFGQ